MPFDPSGDQQETKRALSSVATISKPPKHLGWLGAGQQGGAWPNRHTFLNGAHPVTRRGMDQLVDAYHQHLDTNMDPTTGLPYSAEMYKQDGERYIPFLNRMDAAIAEERRIVQEDGEPVEAPSEPV